MEEDPFFETMLDKIDPYPSIKSVFQGLPVNVKQEITIGLDQQQQEGIEIVSVSFFNITDQRFAWAGVYEPVYPEPWAGQQRNQGRVLEPQLSPHTYLSWPGPWRLTFELPVFTWMHNTQDLGWIFS